MLDSACIKGRSLHCEHVFDYAQAMATSPAGCTEGHSQEREAEADAVEAEMAKACGALNAATGRLVSLLARALEGGADQATGIHSPEHWVGWKCGVSRGRARRLVAMARRLGELSETARAFEAGEVSEDQVAVICRHAPAYADAEVATLARQASVSQLARTLSRYAWAPEPQHDEEDHDEHHEPEARRVSFATTEEGAWRLSAVVAVDEGALVERALEEARLGLIEEAEAERPSWTDALVAMADRSLGATAAARPYRDRHLVVVHLRGDEHGPHAQLHLGAPLPDSLRRLVGCDGRARPVVEVGGVALSVGRAQRMVVERTRMAVEDRDGGCRVPGCGRTRWLQVHHVIHWEDGGGSDTANLVALCARHHRLHHLGRLGIAGNADEADGMEFTDARGRRLTGCGRPAPPGGVSVTGNWSPPSGERLHARWVHFNDPAPAA
jgi:hypothetical protein